MLYLKTIATQLEQAEIELQHFEAECFLRDFEFICAEKKYLLRERAKKVIQSLLTLGYVSPQEVAQIHLHSETDKIHFWYYFFYRNQYIFNNMGSSMRQAFWRIIQRQLEVSPKVGMQNLQNIAGAIKNQKVNPFHEEARLIRFIEESSFNYFTLPLYRHYITLGSEGKASFLQAAAETQQAILADRPWPEVKKMLPRCGMQDKRNRAFDYLLQVMPLQTVFCAEKTVRQKFRANTYRDRELREHLPSELAGKTIQYGNRTYRLGKSIWHIPFGGLADICTAGQPEILWKDPAFNLISIFDEKSYLGFLQILFQDIPDVGHCLVLYGSEPSADLAKENKAANLYQEFVSVCQELASTAGLAGVVQSGCDAWFSNRPQLRDYIEDYVDNLQSIPLGKNYIDYWNYQSNKVYLLPEIKI